MKKIITDDFIDLTAREKAFPYQAQAVEFLKDKEYCAIFHEQGLGKTKIAIDLILYWLVNTDIDTVIIVTKKQLVENWRNEFTFHTHLRPKVLSTNRHDNFYVLNSAHRIIITNYETVSGEKDRISLFLRCRNVAVVVDESTKLKNPMAKLTKDFITLSSLFKIRVIMTGTPVANRPYDIWSQIYFLDAGKSLGNDFNKFKKNSDLTNNLHKNAFQRRVFEETVSRIYDKISSFSVRATKKTSGIILPNKEYYTILAELEPTQQQMYETIIKELALEVNKCGRSLLDDDDAALKRLLRLNQMVSNPKLIDDKYEKVSGKEVVLAKLLNEILGRGEKCIVWSCYIDNIDAFANKYAKYGCVKIHGKMRIEDRNRSVSRFKEDPECKILFATPQSAKEGLTLTVANNVIFYDRSFNLDDYLQAQDRIHRISQKKTCHIYNIKIDGTIDDWIQCLIDAKQRAALLAQGDISLNEYIKIADYSYGKIIKEILESEDNDEH